ncbi:MAG: hypothetical protein GX117_12385 [Candidatus Hydrogenedentes bacterium]|jgi:hypothetical protein|nr:hypothetical protein [Candidatus Hydrogenedentota bacterium]
MMNRRSDLLVFSAALVLALFCGAPSLLYGADNPPTIINIGEAESLAPIGQVEFFFVRHFTAETLEESVTQCETYLGAAPQVIRGSEMQPSELRTSPPVITSIEEHQCRGTIMVRFSMAAFNTPKTGPIQFAALCDKVAALASSVKATVSSPTFYPADKDSVEAVVLTRAAENAFLPAEAVAVAVKSAIYAIDNVEVVELTWEQQPAAQYGDAIQMNCRARVQVTYVLSPQ